MLIKKKGDKSAETFLKIKIKVCFRVLRLGMERWRRGPGFEAGGRIVR